MVSHCGVGQVSNGHAAAHVDRVDPGHAAPDVVFGKGLDDGVADGDVGVGGDDGGAGGDGGEGAVVDGGEGGIDSGAPIVPP